MKQIQTWLRQDAGPARSSGHIRAGSMASGVELRLPFIALRGKSPGRTLWLHGQVHGDEINGIVAALRFANSLDPATMSGNLVVTPTGNPQALDARRKRNPYDELDLDQTYPGNAKGMVSERLAHALFQEVEGVADVLINLHTMNPLFDSKPYSVYKTPPDGRVKEDDLLAAMASFFPALACRMDIGGKGELPGNIAGALDYQCLKAGICAFMVELGAGNRYQPENVECAELGFRSLARSMGILPGGPSPADSAANLRLVSRRGWITADEGGLFVPKYRPGNAVPKGASIGDVIALDGTVTPVPAFPQDGILIGLRSDPVVHTGERLAFVAWEWADKPTPHASWS
ncbi:succinylglutamate desuccinylase/aspartoacylase family protein [Candidimonas humi]|uniref:M14 family metallopeptidase n=1 Tax=Candidimonas humi TaxID=683355 RepID=A0ABV8NUR6_9BURK|nr:M14 family metallopeptidase [Candidimonas humi]MBV6304847.1 succinylglutamate desuccinylase/aspartoacylase family protein [Candidimonas humi]